MSLSVWSQTGIGIVYEGKPSRRLVLRSAGLSAVDQKSLQRLDVRLPALLELGCGDAEDRGNEGIPGIVVAKPFD